MTRGILVNNEERKPMDMLRNISCCPPSGAHSSGLLTLSVAPEVEKKSALSIIDPERSVTSNTALMKAEMNIPSDKVAYIGWSAEKTIQILPTNFPPAPLDMLFNSTLKVSATWNDDFVVRDFSEEIDCLWCCTSSATIPARLAIVLSITNWTGCLGSARSFSPTPRWRLANQPLDCGAVASFVSGRCSTSSPSAVGGTSRPTLKGICSKMRFKRLPLKSPQQPQQCSFSGSP